MQPEIATRVATGDSFDRRRRSRPPIWDDGAVDQPGNDQKRRRTKEELRELLLEAGRSILIEEGLGVGAGDLTFKRAFDRVEAATGTRLTNASVIRRVWENQAEYQTDVLASVAGAGDSTGELLSHHGGRGARCSTCSTDRAPRPGSGRVTEVCRVAGEASFRALVASRAWALWVGIWVLGATSAAVPACRAHPSGAGRGLRARHRAVGGAARGTGRPPRSPAAGAAHPAAVHRGGRRPGRGVRAASDRAEDLTLIERPTGPGGAVQPWTLFGVGLEALAHQFFELDPDWTLPADVD